ncbi:hypothetical protein Sjap_002947 [Stephania japonica]|uniref:Uncharacterized protein n=1 Tax=Stephania japonica TaxID=461633 RepID=A0AAP0PT40_9MAGN
MVRRFEGLVRFEWSFGAQEVEEREIQGEILDHLFVLYVSREREYSDERRGQRRRKGKLAGSRSRGRNLELGGGNDRLLLWLSVYDESPHLRPSLRLQGVWTPFGSDLAKSIIAGIRDTQSTSALGTGPNALGELDVTGD